MRTTDEDVSPGENLAPVASRPPAGKAARRPAVLVVDDDHDVRTALAELLGEEGYQVACVNTGTAALTHLCAGPVPDVVVADVLMPGLNAWELIGEMRRRERLSKVPVILITGLNRQWFWPVPERLVLYKPVDPSRLLGLLREIVAPAGPPRENPVAAPASRTA
jgi:CheY-like chemotaxis protein